MLVSGGAPSPQNLKTKVETSDTSVHKLAAETKKAYTQRAKARAVREMQREMEKNAAEKVAGTGKTVARGISRIKQAVERTGKAIIKAFVGFLGGAGGLITLVLIIGGAAAIIATPFGVFWSGQDESTMTMPMAVAQINAEYEAKLSRIENENHADSNVGCFIFPLYPKIPQKSYTYCVGSEPFIILSVFRTDDIILSFFSLVLSHNLRMGFYLSTQFCDQTSFGVESIMLDFVLQFRIDYKGTANWVENCFQKCSAQSGTMAPLISLIEFVNKNKKEPLFLMNRGSPSRADIMVKAFVCNAG